VTRRLRGKFDFYVFSKVNVGDDARRTLMAHRFFYYPFLFYMKGEVNALFKFLNFTDVWLFLQASTSAIVFVYNLGAEVLIIFPQG